MTQQVRGEVRSRLRSVQHVLLLAGLLLAAPVCAQQAEFSPPAEFVETASASAATPAATSPAATSPAADTGLTLDQRMDHARTWLSYLAATLDENLPIVLVPMLILPWIVLWLVMKLLLGKRVPYRVSPRLKWGAPIVTVVVLVAGGAALYHRVPQLEARMVEKAVYDCVDEDWYHIDVPGLRKWAQCVESRIGTDTVFRETAAAVHALSSVPCRYVGIWRASRNNSVSYIYELAADGRYQASPSATTPRGGSYTGIWGVAGDKMVWFDDYYRSNLFAQRYPGLWPTDLNRIMPGFDADHFTLVELNGVLTYFERLKSTNNIMLSVNGQEKYFRHLRVNDAARCAG